MTAASAIVTDVIGAIAVIRYNQPAARNPLSTSVLYELTNSVSSLTAREDLKAIVFTGAEDVFASGADIRELAQLDQKDALEFSRFGQKLFQTIADGGQVTIAAINGYCMGGALDLALACDLRIASPQAVFAHPGARLGIITGWGGTQRLARLIGKAHALEFFVTARTLTSKEALEIGLVDHVGDPVIDCALEFSRSQRKMPE